MIQIIEWLGLFLLINICGLIWIVLAYFYYEKVYKIQLGQAEPDFAEDIKELSDNISKGLIEALGDIKVDIDVQKFSDQLAQTFYGTFLAILGVEEYSEEWRFQDYLKDIIDSSVSEIVPETIKEFEAILPEFADQFVEGIQKALTGVMSDIPEGVTPQQALPMAAGKMPDLDMGKIIQVMLLQFLMKQFGGGFDLSNIAGQLTQSTSPRPAYTSKF